MDVPVEELWAPQVSAPLPLKRSNQSSDAVSAICHELGYDLDDKVLRVKAALLGKKRTKEIWIGDADSKINNNGGDGIETAMNTDAANYAQTCNDKEV